METCEVVVVGGGPAGSSCAARLRTHGIEPLVIDRRQFPRDKVCAGWITPQVVAELRLDIAEYARRHVIQPITGFKTGMIGCDDEVEVHYDQPVSYGIRRCEFDHFLLERSGAKCRLGMAVDGIERTGKGWSINGRIESPMLVGAGGQFCPVARHLGAQQRSAAPLVTAQEIEIELSDSDEPHVHVAADSPELFFSPDLAGYGWVFRKGRHLNVGLGRVGEDALSPLVAQFVQFLRHRGKITFDLATRFHGHAYRLYDREPPACAADGVLLVGDSAGLAYAESGEGIRPAVESGILAADVIAAAKPDYRGEALARYRNQILARFGMPAARRWSDWLPHGWMAALGRRLLQSRWLVRHVVLDRWFLHRDQPALLCPE